MSSTQSSLLAHSTVTWLEALDLLLLGIKGSQAQIAWGSQIRSYVFMPYTLAKDTRTGYESGNIQAVMDGEIDGFINAYLQALANGTLGKASTSED